MQSKLHLMRHPKIPNPHSPLTSEELVSRKVSNPAYCKCFQRRRSPLQTIQKRKMSWRVQLVRSLKLIGRVKSQHHNIRKRAPIKNRITQKKVKSQPAVTHSIQIKNKRMSQRIPLSLEQLALSTKRLMSIKKLTISDHCLLHILETFLRSRHSRFL